MSTDGNLPDLRFPQTGGHGNAIHLSANTLKQHGRNGEPPFQNQNRNQKRPLLAAHCLHQWRRSDITPGVAPCWDKSNILYFFRHFPKPPQAAVEPDPLPGPENHKLSV